MVTKGNLVEVRRARSTQGEHLRRNTLYATAVKISRKGSLEMTYAREMQRELRFTAGRITIVARALPSRSKYVRN